MNPTCSILLAVILMASCDPKRESLNKSLGWESDHEVKLIYVTGNDPDTVGYTLYKKELDERISAKLEAAHLGESVEKEDTHQADLLFMVPGDYQKALGTIIKETRLYGKLKKFEVFEREYVSETEWIDKLLYAE